MLLGTNVTHIEPRRALELGCKHLEVSLLWEKSLDRAEANTLAKISEIAKLDCDYSIHLPIFSKDYPYHIFSAYYLDEDPKVRQVAFSMLELNLEKLKSFRPKFYVIHFSGVYPRRPEAMEREILAETLGKLDNLARRYNTKLLLEYFGFNLSLLKAEDWRPVLSYPNLRILLDTGHLLFSARMHNLDYKGLFEAFLPMCEAIHLWNSGDDAGTYEDSESYMRFHHMVPRRFQSSELGYGLDMEWVSQSLQLVEVPVIIEASLLHKESGSLEEAINEWRE